MSEQDRFVLITNVREVWHEGLRLDARAVLLEQMVGHGRHGHGDRYQLRGFGFDGAWPIFSVDLTSFEHSLMGDKHLYQLVLKGQELPYRLPKMDPDKPLDVWEKSYDRATRDHGKMFEEVWAELARRAPSYWTAPNRPRLIWERNPLCRY